MPSYFEDVTKIENNWQMRVNIDATFVAIFRIAAKVKQQFYKSNLPSENFIHYFAVCQLILKPIRSYSERTKYYNIQQYFDGPVILKRDEDHFKMVTFFKASGRDRQKHNPYCDVHFWRGRTRDVWWNSRGKEHEFVSWDWILKCCLRVLKAHAWLIPVFLLLSKSTPDVIKALKFKLCINVVTVNRLNEMVIC